jgi:hypothetical protein
MLGEWRVTVRWVIRLKPADRTWTSADARTAADLEQQLAQGLLQPGVSRPPGITWELRDAHGQVLTPAQQGHYLDVLLTIGRALQAHGL